MWMNFIVSLRDNIKNGLYETVLKILFLLSFTVFLLFNEFLLLHHLQQDYTLLLFWQIWNRLMCADLSKQSALAHGGFSLSLVISQPSALLFPKWLRAYLFRCGALKRGDPWCRSMLTKSQRHMSITIGVRFLYGINFFSGTLFLITLLYFFLEMVIDIFLCSFSLKCHEAPENDLRCACLITSAGIMPFQLTKQLFKQDSLLKLDLQYSTIFAPDFLPNLVIASPQGTALPYHMTATNRGERRLSHASSDCIFSDYCTPRAV